jgi:glycosyltransferase involved in cell wall biosynthesis
VRNICFVVTGLNPHGAERSLARLVLKLDPTQFQSIVIALGERRSLAEQLEQCGVKVHCLGVRTALSATSGIFRLAALFRQYRPAIIQGWMYHGNVAAQIGKRLANVNAAVSLGIRQSLDSLSQEKRLTRTVIRTDASLSRKATNIVYVSRVARAQHEAIGYCPSVGSVIPNGFELDRFVPSDQARSEIRRELGLSDSAVLIGLVARYHPMKDHESFLHAASLLLAHWPNVHFVVVGSGTGPGNENLINRVSELRLAQHAHFLGERSDMPRIVAALDILAMSSAWGEGFPNVIGEAMSCGIPCVVTDVGDAAWIVSDTGKVVPPRDPFGLATAFTDLLNLDPDERRKLGGRARARIRQCFSLEGAVMQYENLYESLSKALRAD